MPTVRVLEQFGPDDVEAVGNLADAVERAGGAAPFGETTWLGLVDGGSRADVGLWLPGADGNPDGYADVRHHDRAWSVELATRPHAADGRLALLDAAIAAIANRGGGHVTMWVHAPSDDDDATARAAGLVPERDLLQLRTSLPHSETPIWPEGTTVRTFVPGLDDADWIEVNNRAFAGHPEQGNWTAETLRRRLAEPWFDPAGFLLAFDGEGMAGFCWTKVHPAHPPREPEALGEIYAIGVDPDHRAGGLGRALVVGGLESLARSGVRTGMLFVDADNVAAVRLYTKLGFTRYRLDRAYGLDVVAVA